MSTQDSTPSGVVVVGAGLAGATVVTSLRERGYAGTLTLVGHEAHLPYERPPLSKGYLQGQSPIDEALVHPATWYPEHEVGLRLDDAVVGIDRLGKQVELASGEHLPYDTLVLATGAEPRQLSLPGADLGGVLTLRRIADSDALRSAIADHRRIVIIGGGWIGLEVAAAARLGGCEVIVLEMAKLPLLGVLGPEVAAHFAALHRAHGVDLRTGTSVTEILGQDGRVTGVVADGATIAADIVVVGVGALPNTALAEAAGLEVGSGILTDEHLRSVSDPTILAVGDVAEAHHTASGRSLRVEHWDNAIRHGKLAAATIVADAAGTEGGTGGAAEVYDWAPYFYTDQFDLGMEYVGQSSTEDDTVVRGDMASGEFIAFWLRNGRVSAAMNVNIWDVTDDLRALLGREISPDRLSDTNIALTGL